MVQRKSRLCDAEANEKLTEKNSTGTFKDTASAASRDRTLCLGPVVRHLYISHWSRVVGPSPPLFTATSSFGHFEKRCTSLLFSYFSVSSLSLFSPVSHFETFCLPSICNAILLSAPYFSLFSSFSALFAKQICETKYHIEYSIPLIISILVNLNCLVQIFEWRKSPHR